MKQRKVFRDRRGAATAAAPAGRSVRAMLLAMTAAVLAACQTTSPDKAGPSWRVEPLMRVTSAGETAGAYYSLGRYFQGQNRLDLALAAYRRAVAIDRRHAEAHNAIGAIAGVQGRLDEAIRDFRAALEIAPEAPHILNNLGYALALAGRHAEAVALLQRAAELEPDNQGSKANLALALSRAKLAAEPRESTVAVPPAVPDGGGTTHDSGERPPPLATPERDDLSLQKTYRLEIANGNGVTGAAARFAEIVARYGAPRARLKNHRPFDRKSTVIYVAKGFEAQAQRLASRFGELDVRIEPRELNGADVRIVLGRDMLPVVAPNTRRSVALAPAGERRQGGS